MDKIFPIVLIALNIGAAGVYLYSGDYAKALYWISAASITFSTIWM